MKSVVRSGGLGSTALGLVLSAALGVGAAGAALAAPAPTSVAVDTLVASEAWIRLPPAAATVAAGYVELHNGGADDRLVAASAVGFGQVQIHAMRMDGEVMRMQHLEQGLVLPGGKTTALQPGGYHLMLMLPKRPLQAGQHVRVRLVFAQAGEQQVDFVVRDGMLRHGAGR